MYFLYLSLFFYSYLVTFANKQYMIEYGGDVSFANVAYV